MTKEKLIADMNKGIEWKKRQMKTEFEMFIKDAEFCLNSMKEKLAKNDDNYTTTDLSIILLSAQAAIEHVGIIKNELKIREVFLDATKELD